MAKKPQPGKAPGRWTCTAREGGRRVVDPEGNPVKEESGDADKASSNSGKD